MSNIVMKEIETEQELKEVLDLCYSIPGTDNEELYGYSACLTLHGIKDLWKNRPH